MKIERQRTAIQRGTISRPVAIAMRDGLLSEGCSFFDYGCGHGQDLAYLEEMGFSVSGWDPAFAPEEPKNPADVVNLGYVINVIESPEERAQALQAAFRLAKKVLIVSAMVGFKDRGESEEHGDGVVTRRGTFQKYYEQQELQAYIVRVLKRDCFAASLGIFYIFANQTLEQDFCQRASAERPINTGAALATIAIEKPTLREIADRVAALKRLPQPKEMPQHALALGILLASDDWIHRLTPYLDEIILSETRRQISQEVLTKLCVSNYCESGRLRLADLDLSERANVRALFGSLARAYLESDRLLKGLMRSDRICSSARAWGKGKLTQAALYLHTSLLDGLPFELKLIVCCAAELACAQKPSNTNIVKINHDRLGVSFASYRDFDQDPHPRLDIATRVDFETGSVTVRDYSPSSSPPILHRKELFVDDLYPMHRVFCELTKAEESLGLLGRPDIGALRPWERLLANSGIKLDGHRVIIGSPYSLSDSGPDSSIDLTDSPDEDFHVPLPQGRVKSLKDRKPSKQLWSAESLNELAETLYRLGRAPLPGELELPPAKLRGLADHPSWAALIGPTFDAERFELSRKRRWEHWIVRLATERFQLGGRTKVKNLDASSKADIYSLFGSLSQASAEAEHWLLKIGNQAEIQTAISSWPEGLHAAEKGLYVHETLEPRLPVLLRLLLECARFMAWNDLPGRADVIRFSTDGNSVKLYEYEGFFEHCPAKRLQSVLVDFRKRKVIARDYRQRPKLLGARHEMLAQNSAHYDSLARWANGGIL